METLGAQVQPPKHADLIYDVGLHLGEDTGFYLKKGFRVIAFEADPDLSARCREMFEAQIREGRLVIVEGAIVPEEQARDPSSQVTFYRNLDVSVWGTTHKPWADRNQQLGSRVAEITVPCVDFADALRRYGIPYYMKIDIEGGDFACLEALARFEQRPDFLSLESDKLSLERVEREIRTLESLGYHTFAAVQQGVVQHQAVPDPSLEGRSVQHRFTRGSSGLFGRDLQVRWMPAHDVLRRYREIYRNYRMFGDASFFGRNALARKLLRLVEKLSRRRIPGWYDTHARLGPE